MASPAYKRLVAIDFGTRRIGVAKSDPLGMFAQPVGTFELEGLYAALEAIIREDGIDRIIVGYPLNDRGEANRMTGVIDRFVEELGSRFPSIPVETMDEHRSSREARQILAQSGASRRKRNVKGRVDTAAACVILQNYLDASR
ncbi:MAG: Holliday junction resolvase RuvX [Chlorobiaceae bacterium]|nr:Holliday junction resolvase RuvX [Chlorobiaceae bacterium]